MNELPLAIVIAVPLLLLLYLFGRAATRETDVNERVPPLRRPYYFLEIIAEEVQYLMADIFRFIKQIFKKMG